ncbi:MAG TPA: AAA family ATPase [Bacteroidales bacterium]|nr:AAA family ATPase [Bacteroidales bacterium]
MIITGIRRWGKSTLMQQIMKAGTWQALYLNFKNCWFSDFDDSDYNHLHEMAVE